ncbi:MAG: hypothetical protein II445_08030 [Muribaculaceae bacterium]|nr:hypothetical protein [Muribaculaceae bacterium]
MKRFLKKILIYSIIVMVIFIAYEVALLFVPNEYSYKKNYIEDHKHELKVLVLGNSHLADCIDPSLLGDSIFNAAQPGRSVYYDLQLLKEYIGQMPQLECVILPLSVDYYYWGHRFEKEHEPKFTTYRCMYHKYMGYTYEDKEWWHWSEILSSFYNHPARLVDALYKPLTDLTMCDSLGVEIDASIDTRKDDWYNQQLPSDTPLNDSTKLHLYYVNNLRIYGEIVMLARAHKTRLIFLAMPIYKTARQRINSYQLHELDLFVQRIKRFNPNIEFYNFIDAPGYTEQDYYNSIHLNNTHGARKFAPTLKRILNNRQCSKR